MDALLLVRLSWVEWRSRSLWIHRGSACFGQLNVVIRPIPIATPFPNVARHVVEAEAVRWKVSDRRKASITIFTGILDREFSLPGIRHPFTAGTKFVAPGVSFAG